MATAKKPAAKKPAAKKPAAKKPAAKKPAAKKPAAKKPAAKKPAAKKPAAKKPAAKKPAAAAKPSAGAKPAPAKNVPTDLVHYFRLVFQVAPGGSRRAEFFVAGTIEEIKRAALDDLGSGEGAYHALYYGETIVLQCWEGTRKVASIDLHPFITYRVEGIPEPIRFAGEGANPVLEMDDASEEMMMAMIEEDLDVEVEVDWAKVKLPKLGGRPLTKKEWAPFDEPTHPWAYGSTSDWDMPLRNP